MEGEEKPDYVILHSDASGNIMHWLVIEMKSRPRRPGSIVEQLQAGATIPQDDARFRLGRRVRGLVPVLVKSRGVKDSDLALIRRQTIRFGGDKYPIRVANCGTNIAALIPA